MTASIGPGVTYRLLRAGHDAARPGTRGDLRLHRREHAADLDAAGGAGRHRDQDAGLQHASRRPSESITFTMTHEANGNAVLHIHVPEPNYLDFFGSPQAAGQIGMIKTMLAGARVLLAAEPAGTLVRTSSPFVEGPRVTLLDIDLDTVLADETLLPRIQAVAATPAEAKAVLMSAKGLKINLDPEITIEFTPAK